MVKQAYKKKYDFSNSEKYRLFLKKHLTKLTPRYYSVASCRQIHTVDGPMYALRIVTGEIENHNLEVIAEAWINDEYIYLWRDHCWAIAVDKNSQRILREDRLFDEEFCGTAAGFGGQVTGSAATINVAPSPCNKTMVIHKVGTESID
jgi:hypothetical protein